MRHLAHDICSKEVYNIKPVMYVLFHELFWNPSWTDFTEVKSVVDDFIFRTVAYLQTTSDLTVSHLPAVEYRCTNLFTFPFSCYTE
jgi:hypothetical protein